MTASNDQDFTSEELAAIEELRKRMRNEMDQKTYENTYMFYRFLKARDFHLNHAETMLRKHLQWRNEKGVDTIITDFKPSETLEKYLPYSRFGFDKEGSICRYVPLGSYDAKGIHQVTKWAELEKHIIRTIELDEKLTKERAKNKSGKLPAYVYIYNMKNLSFALATDKKGIEDLIRLGKLYQDNYPERLKSAYFINVSTYFAISFSILKNFFATNVLKKFNMFGSEGWKEELLKIIDADQLPAFLGGKMTDPDGNPMCYTIVNHGGVIPESYYTKKNKSSLSRDPKCKKLVLPRASCSEISLDVKLPGSLIEWEFETKTKDVAFGVFLKESKGDDEKLTELVPLLRMDTEDFSETGMYRCDKPGTYVLLFDNSYSWIRSKEIFYKATVVNPNDHEAQLED